MAGLSRRRFAGALFAAGTGWATVAQARWPEQPIRFVVPWPPGGSADAIGRIIAHGLGAELGRNVVVENVAGASGTIGMAAVARAKPDGYTLGLATSSSNAAAPHLLAKIPFDPVDDFTPIALAVDAPSVLIVSAGSPWRTVQDLVAAAKTKPGRLTYGSGGVGNSGHLSASLFTRTVGIEATHVPYKGNAPALVDLIGGQIDFMFDNNPVAMIRSGKVRALAGTGARRSGALPDVPTLAELGWPDVELTTWFGVAGPRATPPAVVDQVRSALAASLQREAVARQLQELGMDTRTGSTQAFASFWRAELGRYRDLVAQSGAKPD